MLGFFALTLFTSATLLFLVQPMIGRMILPSLGGTPAVWNTCMVFFQTVLLIGYFYTHTVTTYLTRKQQLILQGFVLLLPLALLPFTLGDWTPPEESNPVFSVLGILTLTVGLPFFVVSTTAPLLQKWFGYTRHPAAADPYFLYGASNLGSMLALLAYPLLVEQLFDIDQQTHVWQFGYFLFAGLVFGCIVILYRTIETDAPAPLGAPVVSTAASAITVKPRSGPAPAVERPTWARRLRWIGLAACPSSLMLGVTTYLTTDIAAVPFFWVLPLALYLLTFILVFARWPIVWTEGPHTVILFSQPCLVLFLILAFVANLAPPTWLMFLLHLGAFFGCTLMCHGELARDRPSQRFLTEFFLWMSVGGVVGGLFSALFAPMVFWFGLVEYPIALILCNFLRPSLVEDEVFIPGDSSKKGDTPLGWALDLLIPIGLALLVYGILTYTAKPDSTLYRKYLMPIPVIAVLALAMRPLRFGLGLVAIWLTVFVFDYRDENQLFVGRSFFGMVKVKQDERDGNTYNLLVHGGIDHGRQNTRLTKRRVPLAYFHPLNGIGQVFQKFDGFGRASLQGEYTLKLAQIGLGFDPMSTVAIAGAGSAVVPRTSHLFVMPDLRLAASLIGFGADPLSQLAATQSSPPFAVVGLGVGSLATHATPYQHVDFYEIDPLVLYLSQSLPRKPAFFTYIEDAQKRAANLKVILGDGRLKIKDAHEHWYHVICLDAFSSDAIPVHLLTVEAVELYLSKLAPGGLLVFNATNNYVDIQGVLRVVADQLGLECYVFADSSFASIPEKWGTDYVVMRRKESTIGALLEAKQLPFAGPAPLATYLGMEQWRWLAPFYNNANANDFRMMKTWRIPEPRGRLWTDRYVNLLGAMNIR